MKRILSLILAFCLILAALPPAPASAEENSTAQNLTQSPYAVSKESYYRTYLAAGQSLSISYSLSTGSSGGGFNTYLFRTALTGNESQEQLLQKAKSLLSSGTAGNLIAGGWEYSAPVSFTLSETIQADNYGTGTYLFVCGVFDSNGKYYTDAVCAVAIHIVAAPVPMTGIEYYWCDKNGQIIQEVDPSGTVTIALDNDTRYLSVRLLPANTTNRLSHVESVLTSREESADFLFSNPAGTGLCSLAAQLCGEGYLRAVIDTGNPDQPETHNICNVYVPCEPESTPRVIQEATCTENGLHGYVCKKYHSCGTTFDTTVIPATGHKWKIGSILLEPTEEETGSVRYICENCSERRIETIPTIKTPPEKPYKIVNVVNGVHVYWNSVNGARKYGIWRSETGKDGTYKWLANPTVNHFTDITAESGKTYYYKITVLHTPTNTHSDMSEPIGITFVSTPDITARYNKAAGIKLEWDRIDGAAGYAIYRKSYSGTDAWVRITTIAGNETFTWTDTTVKNNNGTAYKYTIRALAGSNMKTLSGCRNTGRSMVRLCSRVLSSAVQADETSIKCSWTTSAAVTGYEVRFLVDGKVYQTFTIGNYKTGVKTFTGLEPGQTYKIQVRSYVKIDGMGFYSAWSTAKTVTI